MAILLGDIFLLFFQLICLCSCEFARQVPDTSSASESQDTETRHDNEDMSRKKSTATRYSYVSLAARGFRCGGWSWLVPNLGFWLDRSVSFPKSIDGLCAILKGGLFHV